MTNQTSRRWSKRTKRTRDAVLEALRQGATRRAAAAAARIHHSNLYRWMADEPTLREAVEEAEDYAEMEFTRIITSAATTRWQAAAWWLERRRPDQFGRRERVTTNFITYAQQVADQLGVDVEEVLRETERVLNDSRDPHEPQDER